MSNILDEGDEILKESEQCHSDLSEKANDSIHPTRSHMPSI